MFYMATGLLEGNLHLLTEVKTYIKQPPSSYKICPLQGDNRQLHHLRQKSISSQLLCDAAHYELMAESANKEGDQSGHVAGNIGAGGAVNMSA